MINTKRKILTRDAGIELVKSWKSEGKKVVFTNGCFDILHPGHVDYMEKARNLGDKLVVGLNTDASVSRLKGPERPINNNEVRAIMLAALEFVDAIIFFDEDTPFTLIETILPDILVKGNDYSISNIVGADIVISHGGKVETIAMVDGFSTTNFIAKIKKLN